MLTIMLPLVSLLLLPLISTYSWYLITISLIILTCTSCINLIPHYTLTVLSSMSMMDIMSATLIILSIWISMLMLMASKLIHNKNMKINLFMNNCIILLLMLILCFSSSNMFMFYIWFEASLIPTMLLIIIWGYQPERIQASMYLMIYTITASLPLLTMICKMYYLSKNASFICYDMNFPHNFNLKLLWLLTLSAFLVKLPLFSVHLWLPKAHVEAPIAGSMMLAAILLKLGGYGLIRMIMVFPSMNSMLQAPISALALHGAIITGFMCIRQSDLKALIAYSSVGHMGLMIAGIMSNTTIGMYGTLLMMIAHGLVSSALFCLANMTYEALNTRSMILTKGILMINPILSMWWFMFLCANMAAPPTINLLSEIFLITATLSHSLILMVPLMLISFISATYSLLMYSSMNHGSPLLLTNSFPPLFSRYLLLMVLHMAPLLVLILIPNFISSWV